MNRMWWIVAVVIAGVGVSACEQRVKHVQLDEGAEGDEQPPPRPKTEQALKAEVDAMMETLQKLRGQVGEETEAAVRDKVQEARKAIGELHRQLKGLAEAKEAGWDEIYADLQSELDRAKRKLEAAKEALGSEEDG